MPDISFPVTSASLKSLEADIQEELTHFAGEPVTCEVFIMVHGSIQAMTKITCKNLPVIKLRKEETILFSN